MNDEQVGFVIIYMYQPLISVSHRELCWNWWLFLSFYENV